METGQNDGVQAQVEQREQGEQIVQQEPVTPEEVLEAKGRWRRSPDILKILGLTEAEMHTPLDALVKEGVLKMWKVREALRAPLEFEGEMPEALREAEADWAERRRAMDWKKCGMHLPLWQTIAGFEECPEAEMSPTVRDDAIQRLLRVVVNMLRFEMKEADAKKDDWRSYMWDPLPKLCFYLGISRAKLTRYSKEMMGLAAHELVDGIRVKSLRARMKESLRTTVAFLKQAESSDPKERAFAVWKELKVARKTPKWDRQSWAIGLGFPNYSRMYRACLVLFGKTPAQMEFEVIEELCVELAETTERAEAQVPEEKGGVGSEGDKVHFF